MLTTEANAALDLLDQRMTGCIMPSLSATASGHYNTGHDQAPLVLPTMTLFSLDGLAPGRPRYFLMGLPAHRFNDLKLNLQIRHLQITWMTSKILRRKVGP